MLGRQQRVRRLRQLVLLAALALAAGCGAETPTPVAPPSGMVAYTPPPAEVPVVEVDGSALRPAQYAWRVGGEYQTHSPTSDRDVATNRRQQSDGGLTFSILTRLRPLQARVLVYNSVGPNAVPAAGSASVLDCIAKTGCRIVEAPTGLVVELTEQPVAPALVALDVQYATLEPADTEAGIASFGASWVVRLVPKA